MSLITKHYNEEIHYSVLFPTQILMQMFEVARPHLPLEFGGILTAIKGERQDIIIDFKVPTKYEQTTTGFTRHVDDLNVYLGDIYSHSDGKIEYIGEWHTHPYSTPDFSPKDFKSMDEIAKDENSKNNSPLLIILGMKKTTFTYKIYKYHNGELILLDKTVKL